MMPDATRTQPKTAADMVSLAELIERQARENAENRAAAALWQERARFLRERLSALEAGPIAAPESAESEHASQDAKSRTLRDAAREMDIRSRGAAADQ
jgi:hypothetical protein